MQRPIRLLAVLALIATVAGGPHLPSAPAVAQQPATAPIIIVVDVQGVVRESMAAKSIRTQMQSHRQTFTKEITDQEKSLRSAEQELQRQRTILSADAFGKKRKEFEDRVGSVQRSAQARKRQLDEAFNDAMEQVQKALVEVVTKLAEERNATLVIPKTMVVLVDKRLDVSEEALKRLDARIQNVAVSLAKR